MITASGTGRTARSYVLAHALAALGPHAAAPYHRRELDDVTPRHTFDPYGGKDPRAIPAYSIAKAAHYLSIPENTVRSWVSGRTFPA